MAPQTFTCVDCKWWEEIQLFQSSQEKQGYCHRYPPTLPNDDRPNSDKRQYPIVTVGWCGEWIRK